MRGSPGARGGRLRVWWSPAGDRTREAAIGTTDSGGGERGTGPEVRAATAASWEDLEALWGDSGGCDGCWCFNHHVAPGAPDVRGEAARAAKRTWLAAGRAGGVIGYLDGRPAGWCAVDRGRDLPGHDCVPPAKGGAGEAEDGVRYVHCFFVHPSARGRGLARALLRGALDLLRAEGVKRVVAFPTPPGRPPLFHAFAGPFGLYEQEGFLRAPDDLGGDYCRVVRDL